MDANKYYAIILVYFLLLYMKNIYDLMSFWDLNELKLYAPKILMQFSKCHYLLLNKFVIKSEKSYILNSRNVYNYIYGFEFIKSNF